MAAIGTFGLGLVWGWLLVRLLRQTNWRIWLRMLFGLGVQGAVIVALVGPLSLLWFTGGGLAGVLLAAIWVLTLERERVTR